MVNYHDPAVVVQDTLALLKLWHAVAGLYFWEFVTTLDYEWSVIRRHRPYRWSIWVYSTTRIASVISLVICLYCLNFSTPYNCEVGTILQLVLGHLAIAAASLLIVLRILAIWNKNKIIVVIVTGVLGTNAIFLIQGIVRIRAVWEPEMSTCSIASQHVLELNVLVILATDIILLLVMLFGLLRLGCHERGAFGVGRLLWKQGLIWLLVATVAEVLPAVFICLNLNDRFNYMFLPPSMVTLSIAATRIHRGLADYASIGHTEQPSDPINFRGNGCIERKATNRAPITISPLSRMERAINGTCDQDQMPQTSQCRSFISVEGQSCGEPSREPRFDENAENGVGVSNTIAIT